MGKKNKRPRKERRKILPTWMRDSAWQWVISGLGLGTLGVVVAVVGVFYGSSGSEDKPSITSNHQINISENAANNILIESINNSPNAEIANPGYNLNLGETLIAQAEQSTSPLDAAFLRLNADLLLSVQESFGTAAGKHLLEGYAAKERGDHELSAQHFKAAYEFAQQESLVKVDRVQILLTLSMLSDESPDVLLGYAEQAVQADPTSIQAQFVLTLLSETHHSSAAEKAFLEINQLTKDTGTKAYALERAAYHSSSSESKVEYLELAIGHIEALGATIDLASLLGRLGEAYIKVSKFDLARDSLEEARDIFLAEGDLNKAGLQVGALGALALRTEGQQRACELFEEAGSLVSDQDAIGKVIYHRNLYCDGPLYELLQDQRNKQNTDDNE